MRSFFMGLLIAAGVAFLLLTQVRTMRVNMPEGPVRISYTEPPRTTRTASTMRSVKHGTTDKSFQEFKVVGMPRPTKELAYEDALIRAANELSDHFGLQAELTAEDVKQLLRDNPTEIQVPLGKDEKSGEDLGSAFKVEMNLQMDNSFVEQLAQRERESRMTQRMHILARGLAVMVAGLFAIAGYVRLDEWSKGYYSGLLKAVAVVAVVGIGLAVWMK